MGYGKASFLQQPFGTGKPEMVLRCREVRLYFRIEEQAFLLITKGSRNDTPDLTLFLSAHALTNPRFRLLLRFLRHRAKMAVGGSLAIPHNDSTTFFLLRDRSFALDVRDTDLLVL